MASERSSRQTFLGVSALLFVASAALTTAWCASMSTMCQMPMPGGWTMSMAWMPIPGQTWAGAAVSFVGMWVVMMVGMMAGSALPVMLLFAGAHARRGGGRAPFIVLIFGLGYLTVWVGFSACATLAQWALHHAAVLSPEMAASSPRIGGAILCAAGVYQLTPFKRACLMHCQSPLGFLMTRWRDGTSGALQMGMRHGGYCLGCCWALMSVLVVVGLMNLVWMAGLALIFLAEKNWRYGAALSKVAGVAVGLLGIAVIVDPGLLTWVGGGMLRASGAGM